jgi:opacity protein-like surface antigen
MESNHRNRMHLLGGVMAVVALLALVPGVGADEVTDDFEVPVPAAAPSPPPPPAPKPVDYGRTGPVLGLGAVFAAEDFGLPSGFGGDGAWGYDVRGGYRVHKYLGVEGQFQHMHEFGVDDASGTNVSQIDAYAFTLNGKLYLMPKYRVQPYFAVGIGFLNLDGLSDDDTQFASRVGGGLEGYLTENVVLYFEASHLFADTELVPDPPLNSGKFDSFDFTSLAVGFQYRF